MKYKDLEQKVLEIEKKVDTVEPIDPEPMFSADVKVDKLLKHNHSGGDSVRIKMQDIVGRTEIDLWLDAAGIRAPGDKPASFVEYGLTGVWQFGNEIEANQESISGTVKIPSDMDRDVAPLFKIGWSADGASPGNCKWQLEYLWIGLNEATNAAAQGTLTVISTASTVSNGLIITPFTGIDLPSSTDKALFFKITRLSGDVQDTIADDVEMRGRLFTYTKNTLGKKI